MCMMDNNRSSCHISHDLDMYMFPIIYITVIVISIPTNCISLYISYQQIKKKNELGVYLFNLSLSDLLYTTTLPFWVDFSLNHNHWRFADWACKLSAFFMHTNLYSSAGFLTCISIDRYLAVVFPLKFYQLRTRTTAVLVSLLVWTLQGASNVVILLKRETFIVISHKAGNNSNEVNDTVCYDNFPMEEWKSYFSIVNVCSGHFLPLIIMVFCYLKIYAAVKTNQATDEGDKIKIKQLLFAIVVSFVISFTPYHIVLLIRSLKEPNNCTFANKMFYPYKITLALSSVNCMADPFLYCFVSEAGRADLRTLLNCFTNKFESSSKNGSVTKNEYMMGTISRNNVQENECPSPINKPEIDMKPAH
ncbi:psychosine receptor [Pelobates fuscus]|uniref:psychosine receptor n=1 Tax=Pelobates fuscus TaxID=191477 RepID=UPI002FE4689B